MNPASAETLRRSAVHVVVDDVEAPQLDDADDHHVFRVLRVRDGEVVTVTDGAGAWRVCRARTGRIEADGDVRSEPRHSRPVSVAFAIPKQDRPEWIVQKLTELGVDRIHLLHAERSVVRWSSERADRHLTKMARIATEAIQQSRQVWLPVIDGPLPAIDVLPGAVVAEPGGRALASTDRTIAIGPEGGWSAGELAAAADRVSLGASVLRVETAALSAAARMIAHAE